MRLIIRGNRSSAYKVLGYAKNKLAEVKRTMKMIGVEFGYREFRFGDVVGRVESVFGQDCIWLVGKGIRSINDEFLPEALAINVSMLAPVIHTALIRETREKLYLGVGTESEVSVHAAFLALAWSAWDDDLAPPGVDQTPYYLGGERTIGGDDTWLYRARERRHQFLITASPPFTISVQVYPGQQSGFGTNGGLIKAWWEEDLLFFGVDPNPGSIESWRTLFTIEDTDLVGYNPVFGDIITIRVEDNDYLFLNSGNNSNDVGWHLDTNFNTGVRISI